MRRELDVTQQQRADEQAQGERADAATESRAGGAGRGIAEISQRFLRQAARGAGRPARHCRSSATGSCCRATCSFGISSSELTPAGIAQMTELAATFRKIIDKIPADVNWVLRVDGHTDATPIHTGRFPSNWELSAARAITVVKFLTTQGIPARHLAATGFGENQPVDPADTPEAYAKNRRIEIRLTDR